MVAKYYDGIHKSAQDLTVGRTKHTWSFAKNLDVGTKMQLDTARDKVEHLTNKNAPVEGMTMRTKPAPEGRARSHPLEDDPDRQRIMSLQSKAPVKAFRKHNGEVEEELVGGKATGRDALIEKRREVGAKIHGAAKAREEDRDGLTVGDDKLYGGGGGDSFQAALARRNAGIQRKQDQRDGRIDEIQSKETDRMKSFMASMGIAPGQKIVMRERDD